MVSDRIEVKIGVLVVFEVLVMVVLLVGVLLLREMVYIEGGVCVIVLGVSEGGGVYDKYGLGYVEYYGLV